jgi:hypothetical protein
VANSDITIYPESLRTAADAIGATADRFNTDLVVLIEDLAGFGEPWGADDIGTLIGQAYVGIREMALACYESNVDELADYAGALALVADDFDEAEADNDSLVSDLVRMIFRG